MKRFLEALAALTLCCSAAFAYEPAINDIDILVVLLKDGTAEIQEKWDVVVADGTEWYLVRNGMDGSVISDFAVLGDNGEMFKDDGDWDVNRSLKQKAGRSGIVRKGRGYELCWGVGSYGPHKFTARYKFSGAVRALDDYDYFHWQLVTPGLSANPKHVRVTFTAEKGIQLDTATTRAWGFGFSGNVGFYEDSDDSQGYVVYESDEPFQRSSSVIALLRFDKGLFEPGFVESGSFQTRLDNALKGSSYKPEDQYGDEDDDNGWIGVLFFVSTILFAIGTIKGAKKISRYEKKKILGQKPEDVSWCRDLPYGGDLYAAEYTMKRLGEITGTSTMASALILRMIYQNQLSVTRDAKGKLEIRFTTNVGNIKDPNAQTLFNMMREASGSDLILQENEFRRWSSKSRNQKRILNWSKSCESNGLEKLRRDENIVSTKYTELGQLKARECFGFKKFLQDFTLIKERTTAEVTLWQEYLVFASLFGIAEKVAKELKEINTEVADQVLMTGMDTTSMYDLIRMTNMISRSITNANAAQSASTGSFGGGSFGGFGGHTSFGGGGGFHGGGFGGGSR